MENLEKKNFIVDEEFRNNHSKLRISTKLIEKEELRKLHLK